MIFITKKKIVILVSSILGILIAAASTAAAIMHNNYTQKADKARISAAIDAAQASLPLKEEPDYGGAALNILCDTVSAKELGADDLTESTILQQASRRNDHFEMATGTEITFTAVDDFLSAAREDILSGTFKHNLYAASAESLTQLVTSDLLRDISESAVTVADGYDAAVTDKLSLYGKRLLFSSSVLDARDSITAIAYDRESTADITFEGKTLAELAKDGQFTIEALITACKADENIAVHYKDTDIYALYFGAGGSFVSFTDGVLEINPYIAGQESFNQVKSLVSANVSVPDAENAVFTVIQLSDIEALRSSGKDIGILPLPKSKTDAEYRSYIDLKKTALLAMPQGAQNTSGLDLLVSEYMALSSSYIDPHRINRTTAGNPDDRQLLDIIYAGSGCDLAILFGYGDIDGMLYEMTADDERFAINYYNRKELIEKAFSIIEKRITEE